MIKEECAVEEEASDMKEECNKQGQQEVQDRDSQSCYVLLLLKFCANLRGDIHLFPQKLSSYRALLTSLPVTGFVFRKANTEFLRFSRKRFFHTHTQDLLIASFVNIKQNTWLEIRSSVACFLDKSLSVLPCYFDSFLDTASSC
jgi:hypothetical protein